MLFCFFGLYWYYYYCQYSYLLSTSARSTTVVVIMVVDNECIKYYVIRIGISYSYYQKFSSINYYCSDCFLF